MAWAKQGETKADGRRADGSRLAEWLEHAAAQPLPAPVERWNPPDCGAIDMRIDRAGAWHHEGRRIERDALVRLFARVLRREADGSHVLVTPVEKLAISVEDAPFLAVEMTEDAESDPPRLVFVTNLGDVVPLDADHLLRIGGGEAFVPYITVRGGLEARLTASLAEALALRAETRDGRLGVVSAGHFFVIGDAAASEAA